jgi:hypothetical protein
MEAEFLTCRVHWNGEVAEAFDVIVQLDIDIRGDVSGGD